MASSFSKGAPFRRPPAPGASVPQLWKARLGLPEALASTPLPSPMHALVGPGRVFAPASGIT